MDLMTDWQPEVMFAGPGTLAGLRTMPQARYRHLVLKLLAPPVTDSGLYEACWTVGKAESGTEEDLLRVVCEKLRDCGTAWHDWMTVSEVRHPSNEDNVLRTQRLECAYCDTRERVISVSSPRDLPAPARADPRSMRPRGPSTTHGLHPYEAPARPADITPSTVRAGHGRARSEPVCTTRLEAVVVDVDDP